MCRVAAYLGPPRPLEDIIIQPCHSLLAQSSEALEAKLAVNGDGFGLAWYGSQNEPGLYRDTLPAWSDGNLLSISRHIESPLFLAHVRASTTGETSRANCHPFSAGRWSFMHNGQIGHFETIRRTLEAELSDELYNQRVGTTDSELLFLLLLNAGLNDDPEKACAQAIQKIYSITEAHGLKPFLRLTCVFSNGETLFGFRHASDGKDPSLYASTRFANDATVLASEPLDGVPENWMSLEPNRLMSFTAGTETPPMGTALLQ